jgi:hypothetical protein
MTSRRRALIAAAVAVAALALPAAAAQAATTFTVAKGGGMCGGSDTACESLNAAAGAVSAGDVVNVAPGVYDEAPTFTTAGVTINGSTDAPGVIVTGTISFTGNGPTPSILQHLIISPSTLTSPAVGVSGSAGVAVRDAFLISGGGSGMTISSGAGNELTRTTVISGAPDGKAVEIQGGTTSVALALSSTILSGGPSGTGLFVKTGVGTLLGSGTATIAARHVTIAGSATAISLDASAGLVAAPAGSIEATVTDSIVLGANSKLNNPGLPPLLPANAATLTFTRTDQTTPVDQVFVNAAKRNLHLRPDAVDIDKGQLTAGDSATDVDGQPRVAGAAPDLGADEFVNSVPTAAFVVKTSPPRSTRPVAFDASTSTDREGGVGGGIVQYQWNFGDGTTESTTTPTVNHTYAKQGTFVASLIVVDRQGALSPVFAAPLTLTDGAPPVVVITKPRSGQAIALVTKAKKTVTKKGKKTKTTASKRTRVGFAGTAKDPSGIGAVFLTLERIAVASKQTAKKKATSAAAKKPAKRCSWLDPKTGFVSRRCDKPVLIRTAVRGGSWAYNIATRLKLVAGSYRVSVYGTDGAGAFGNSAPARDRVVRFTLK